MNAMIDDKCVFCNKPAVLENDLAKGFFDIRPMAPGHFLIVPKEHYVTFFDAPRDVQIAMVDLLDQAKTYLDEQYHPRGYQVFSHVGAAAYQKVFHAHIHLVPVA